MRRSVSVAVLTMTVVLAIGTIATGQKNFLARAQQKPETMEVKIDNFSFGPATLTVPVGTSVTWTNRDDIPHTVVSTEGAFKSKVLDTTRSSLSPSAKPELIPTSARFTRR